MLSRRQGLLLAGTWFLLDQVTKLWAVSGALDRPLTLIPHLLRFSLGYNRGALFGFLADFPDPYRSLVLVVVPLAAIGLIAALLVKSPSGPWTLALALMLGGAAGNLLDRLVHGRVTDFIDVHAGWQPVSGWLLRTVGTNRWPTFNVADIGLTCGTTLMIYASLRASSAKEDPHAPLPD